MQNASNGFDVTKRTVKNTCKISTEVKTLRLFMVAIIFHLKGYEQRQVQVLRTQIAERSGKVLGGACCCSVTRHVSQISFNDFVYFLYDFAYIFDFTLQYRVLVFSVVQAVSQHVSQIRFNAFT